MGTTYWDRAADMIEAATPEEALDRLAALSQEQRAGIEATIALRRAGQDDDKS